MPLSRSLICIVVKRPLALRRFIAIYGRGLGALAITPLSDHGLGF